jgi:hypothetical protein
LKCLSNRRSPTTPDADPREAGFGPGEDGDSIEEGRPSKQGEQGWRRAGGTTTPDEADQTRERVGAFERPCSGACFLGDREFRSPREVGHDESCGVAHRGGFAAS